MIKKLLALVTSLVIISIVPLTNVFALDLSLLPEKLQNTYTKNITEITPIEDGVIISYSTPNHTSQPNRPYEFFYKVHEDIGDDLYIAEWKKGYYFEGYLRKTSEFGRSPSGKLLYNYQGWLYGYNPDLIQPYSNNKNNK